jgi:hypothetical protein
MKIGFRNVDAVELGSEHFSHLQSPLSIARGDASRRFVGSTLGELSTVGFTDENNFSRTAV